MLLHGTGVLTVSKSEVQDFAPPAKVRKKHLRKGRPQDVLPSIPEAPLEDTQSDEHQGLEALQTHILALLSC